MGEEGLIKMRGGVRQVKKSLPQMLLTLLRQLAFGAQVGNLIQRLPVASTPLRRTGVVKIMRMISLVEKHSLIKRHEQMYLAESRGLAKSFQNVVRDQEEPKLSTLFPHILDWVRSNVTHMYIYTCTQITRTGAICTNTSPIRLSISFHSRRRCCKPLKISRLAASIEARVPNMPSSSFDTSLLPPDTIVTNSKTVMSTTATAIVIYPPPCH